MMKSRHVHRIIGLCHTHFRTYSGVAVEYSKSVWPGTFTCLGCELPTQCHIFGYRIDMTLVSHQTFAPKTKFSNKIALYINYCPYSLTILSCISSSYPGSECLFSVAADMKNPDKCVS
jgi:hypothetical protein